MLGGSQKIYNYCVNASDRLYINVIFDFAHSSTLRKKAVIILGLPFSPCSGILSDT